MVDAQKQVGFHQLGLNGRRPHGNNRFLGEHRGTLRHRPDVSGKPEICQIIQEILGEQLPSPEIFNILRFKMQLLDVLDNLLQPSCNGKAAPIGAPTEKQVEIGNPIRVTLGKIPLSHGQFVKIAEHGQVQFLVDNHVGHLAHNIGFIIGKIQKNSNPFLRKISCKSGNHALRDRWFPVDSGSCFGYS